MDKKRKNSESAMLLLLGGLIGVLVGIAIGMSVLIFAYPAFQSDKWAAWVQALGALVTIVAAIGVAFYQSWQKRVDADAERQSKELGTLLVLRKTVKRLMEIESYLISNFDVEHPEKLLVLTQDMKINYFFSAYDEIKKIPIHDSPYSHIYFDFYSSFLTLEDTYHYFLSLVESDIYYYSEVGEVMAVVDGKVQEFNNFFDVGMKLSRYKGLVLPG